MHVSSQTQAIGPVSGRRTKVCAAPHDSGVCADILGFDFLNYSKDDVAAVKAIWLEHGVIRFKRAAIDDEQHIAFASHFGEFVIHGKQKQSGAHGHHPQILSISNILADGKPVGALGNDEATWHTDTWFHERPSAASMLRALIVPAQGGKTYFLSTYRAYDTLPADLRSIVEGRQLFHQRVYDKQGALRFGQAAPRSTDFREWDGVAHPIVRTHGETGRRALYIGGTPDKVWILGMSLVESDEIVRRLWRHVTSTDRIFVQEWEVGDIVMWDNRCTMHRRDRLDPTQPRLMHRTATAGERPV